MIRLPSSFQSISLKSVAAGFAIAGVVVVGMSLGEPVVAGPRGWFQSPADSNARDTLQTPAERREAFIESLNLTDTQQQALTAIREQAQANAELLQQQLTEIRALLDTELAKPEPDLRGVVNEARSRFDVLHAQVKANMDSRLDLYETMSPEQKALVAARLQQTLDRLDRIREIMELIGAQNPLTDASTGDNMNLSFQQLPFVLR